jgi:methionyl-tRNA synthetase
VSDAIENANKTVGELMSKSEYVKAIQEYLKLSDFANKYFNEKEIWQTIKTDERMAKNIMYNLLQLVEALRINMGPFLPVGAEKLSKLLGREFYNPVVREDKWTFQEVKETKLTEEVGILFEKLDKEEVLKSKQ